MHELVKALSLAQVSDCRTLLEDPTPRACTRLLHVVAAGFPSVQVKVLTYAVATGENCHSSN